MPGVLLQVDTTLLKTPSSPSAGSEAVGASPPEQAPRLRPVRGPAAAAGSAHSPSRHREQASPILDHSRATGPGSGTILWAKPGPRTDSGLSQAFALTPWLGS